VTISIGASDPPLLRFFEGEQVTRGAHTSQEVCGIIDATAGSAMSTADEAEALLSRMTRGEKAQLLQRVARDLGDAYPGIDITDEVSGGEACVARTRIPVWMLEQARRLGATEADILRTYPGLRAQDLANAWAYARAHRDEIELQIRENEAA
jgi:uncharacterized protein (DUF433 family)